MIKVTPFRRWHMQWLQQAGAAADGRFGYGIDVLMELEKQNSWTAVLDGTPVACGGTMLHWPGRHMAWVYFNPDTRPHMLALTRAVVHALSKVRGRVEFTVRADFKQGHRWAKMLGFSVETPLLKQYGPEGEDHVGYVRFIEE